MLRMGLPEGAVVLKMQADGIDAASIAAFTNQAAPTPSMDRQPSSRADAPPPRRPPPPRASLSQPAAARSPPPPAPEAAAPDPRMQKYSKMLRMGLPAGAVALKMQADGIDAATIAAFTDQNSGGGAAPAQNATQRAAAASASRRAIKRTGEAPARAPPPQAQAAGATQDPRYAKFAKMLKMGLPAGAVAHKMRAEGVDESTIAAVTGEPPLASGGGGSAAPQSRPAPALGAGGGGALSLRSQIGGGTQLEDGACGGEQAGSGARCRRRGAQPAQPDSGRGPVGEGGTAAESRPAAAAGGGALSLRSQIKAGANSRRHRPRASRPAPPRRWRRGTQLAQSDQGWSQTQERRRRRERGHRRQSSVPVVARSACAARSRPVANSNTSSAGRNPHRRVMATRPRPHSVRACLGPHTSSFLPSI